MLGGWLVTLIFLVLMASVIGGFVVAGRITWVVILIMAVPGLCAVLLTCSTIVKTIEYHKFGAVYFWQQGDARVGGALRGIVDMPAKVTEARRLRAELICLKVYWSQSRINKKTASDMIEMDHWRTARQLPIMGNAQRLELAIAMDIPADRNPTNLPQHAGSRLFEPSGPPPGGMYGQMYYRWELRVSAEMPGADLERTFRVRVLPADTETAGSLPAGQPQAPV